MQWWVSQHYWARVSHKLPRSIHKGHLRCVVLDAWLFSARCRLCRMCAEPQRLMS